MNSTSLYQIFDVLQHSSPGISDFSLVCPLCDGIHGDNTLCQMSGSDEQ